MCIGMPVIAVDEWYGAYTGTVKGLRSRYGSGVRVLVEIESCIVQPSDRAILNSAARYHREPYAPGTIQHFALDGVHEVKIPNAC